MPTYNYECPSCANEFEEILPVSRYQEPQSCPKCGEVANKVLSPVGLVFVGDGWASKNNRVAGQMRKKNERVSAKQEERKRDAPGIRLAPNVNGERVESWSEAKKLASSKNLNSASYDAKIRSETVKSR